MGTNSFTRSRVPYAGFADIFNPAPLPQPTLPWPITPVTYQGGFSAALPFGPACYSYLHALNGLSVFQNGPTGNFAIAVQISEYRNGNLISVTRRDMQLIALVCPENQTRWETFLPALSSDCGRRYGLFRFYLYRPGLRFRIHQCPGRTFQMVPPATFTQQYANGSLIQGEVCSAASLRKRPACSPTVSYTKRWTTAALPQQQINLMNITVLPDTAQLFILGDTLVCGLEQVSYQTGRKLWYFSLDRNGRHLGTA